MSWGMRSTRLAAGIAAIVVGAMAGPALAQQDGWTVGLGAGVAPDYEGSDDYQPVPIPFLRWQGGHRYFKLEGLKAKGNVLNTEIIEFGPVVNIRMERDDVDDNQVDDLDKVDTAVEIGGFVGFSLDNWNAAIEGRADVADAHNGWLVAVEGGYDWPINTDWALSLGGKTTYASGNYMNKYFSISLGNSINSGLDTYNADSGIKDVGGDVALSYNGFGNWGVTGLFAYTRLLNDAKDSPVTDDAGSPDQLFGGVLVTYRFGS